MNLSVTSAAWSRSGGLWLPEGQLSWADLAGRAEEAGSRLREVEGLVPLADGTQAVALRLAPGLDSVCTVLAALELGVPLLVVPPAWPRSQVERALGVWASSQQLELARFEGRLDLEAIAVVMPTSGSSAAPKLAQLSRRALLAAVTLSAPRIGWDQGGRWLTSLAPSTIGGLSILTRALVARASVALFDGGTFTASSFVAMLTTSAATHASLVPTMLVRLVAAGLRPPPTLRAVLIGGAAAPVELLERAWDLGWPALPSWGATETCALAATLPLEWLEDRSCAPAPLAELGCGPALPGIELGIAEGEDAGVLLVRGETLFSGYLGGPAFPAGSWHRSGDVARLDQHRCLHVLGRADGVVISGGRKVHPEQIEAELAAADGVDAVCVVGLPDPEWGQRLVAVVAPVAGAVLDPAELANWLAGRVERWAVPREILVFPSMPQLAGGKVDRQRVRQMVVGS